MTIKSILSATITLISLSATAQIGPINDGRNDGGLVLNGYISSFRRGCSDQLCTDTIQWRSRSGRNTVVTVESPTLSPEEGHTKLFACGRSSGQQDASWIKPGHTYIFRLFESRRCTVDVEHSTNQLDQLTVFGRTSGGGAHDPGDPGFPGNNFGDISAFRSFCNSDLCTYNINWSSRWSNGTVLTVQIPGETTERLMACAASRGTAQAPWIAHGKPYIFRVYETTQCTADVGRFLSPAAQAVVVERGFGLVLR